MNLIDIENVLIPTKGVATKFAIRALDFSLPATEVVFYWQAFKDGENEPEKILDGNLSLQGEDLEKWGANDNYVIEWALNKLQFKLKTI